MTKKKPAEKVLPLKKALPKIKKPAPSPVQVPTLAPGEPFQIPRGMRDILPADEPYWALLMSKAEVLARSFGYGRIETPILEHKGLFVRAVGAGTDIVTKEMYSFVDQGGDELTLRPEGTAAIARAYISHGMLNLPQPVKLWYSGPFFRREKPQAGRFRQFHQWGLEILGDTHSILDTEVILIAMNLFAELNLPVALHLNSLGCVSCRGNYRQALTSFYQGKRELLCAVCRQRLEQNPLRLLDCKEPQCEMLKEGAPVIVDILDEGCRDHFMKVLEYLDDAGIAYQLDNQLVRGLDYYNRTVFEIFPIAEDGKQNTPHQSKLDAGQAENREKTEEQSSQHKGDEEDPSSVIHPPSSGSQSALGGGGRYDGLIEMLGGRPTPAVGCSLGLERVVSYMKARNAALSATLLPKVFVAQLGDVARRKALTLWAEIRREVPAAASLSKDGLKAQLEIANRLGVRFAVIIGQKEIMDGTAIVRDMEAGIQEIVDVGKVVGDIKKKLGNGG